MGSIPLLRRLPAIVLALSLAACASPGPAPTMRGFAVSRAEFREGDSIEIDEVRGTHDTFAEDGVYRVRGRYTLASADRAHLALTTTNGRTEGVGERELEVERGTGAFDFTFRMVKLGYPHLWMANPEGGSAFAHLWFGTEGTQFQPGWEHEGFWGPEPKPIPFSVVPFGFGAGDTFDVADCRAVGGRVREGARCLIEARYGLASCEAAEVVLLQHAGDGGKSVPLARTEFERGTGTLSLPFQAAGPGELTLLVLPRGGGKGLGTVRISFPGADEKGR